LGQVAVVALILELHTRVSSANSLFRARSTRTYGFGLRDVGGRSPGRSPRYPFITS
jgi:hypothetical protein